VTGNITGRIGLVDLYDVFGLASQTLQGADLLAVRLNAVVLVPDFFEGDALKHEYVPADTEEKQKIISDFLAHRASFSRNLRVLLEAVQQYKKKFSSVEHWGAFGLCWGGKVGFIMAAKRLALIRILVIGYCVGVRP
jgi:dienelactone hydrolase